MEETAHKNWRVLVSNAAILFSVIIAILLTYNIKSELAENKINLNHINRDDLYLRIGGICAVKEYAANFTFDDKIVYKLYTDDYGSEVVYTNSYSVYDLYMRLESVYQYLTFDIPLLDRENVEVYAGAATIMRELKNFLVKNADKNNFYKNINQFYSLISAIEHLKEIWEQEAQKEAQQESTYTLVFARSVFKRFNEERTA